MMHSAFSLIEGQRLHTVLPCPALPWTEGGQNQATKAVKPGHVRKRPRKMMTICVHLKAG